MSGPIVHAHLIDGTALVVAHGDLDMAQSSRLRAVLRDTIDGTGTPLGRPFPVVLDLTDVSFIDASIAGVLAGQLAHADRVGTSLRAFGAASVVLEVLELLDLAKPLSSYEPRWTAPARPDLACCDGRDRSAQSVAEELAARESAPHEFPNAAIYTLLSAAAELPADDPQREELRTRAIELALPAAYHMAGRYRGRGEREDDLVQVAALGLVKAIDGYDPQRGHRFSDYALPTVLGELRRYFRDFGWAMRVPRPLQELLLDARRVGDTLTQDLSRTPEAADIAAVLDVPPETMRAALAAAEGYRPQSLSSPVGDGATELGDFLGTAEAGYERVDNWQSVVSVLNGLPARTRRILALRFGAELTQSQIAVEVGLSQMHVSRLLSHAFTTLRASLVPDPA